MCIQISGILQQTPAAPLAMASQILLKRNPRTVSALLELCGGKLHSGPVCLDTTSYAARGALRSWPGHAAILTTSAAPLSPLQRAAGAAQSSTAAQQTANSHAAAQLRPRTAFSTVVAGVRTPTVIWWSDVQGLRYCIMGSLRQYI